MPHREVTRQFKRMLALCAGDRELAKRLSGYDPDAVTQKVVRLPVPPRVAVREEPMEIDWTACQLAQRYGVR